MMEPRNEGVRDSSSNSTGSLGGKRKSPEVDPKMELTSQERQWALQIKRVFQEDDEVLACTFSDMEIAAFAIVDQDDTGKSLARAQRLQAFRMQYDINNTTEEAIGLFNKQQKICPGMMLSIEECPNDDGKGSHANVIDLAKYYPFRFLQNPKDFRCNIGSLYYLIRCTQPDLKSVRDGFRMIIECDGVGWQNVSFKAEMKNIDEVVNSLPYRRKQVKCLRVPSVWLVVLSLLRPFLPKEEYDAFQFGTEELQQEFPERMDQLYMQPTAKEAWEHLMGNCRGFLERRAENEQTFRLD